MLLVLIPYFFPMSHVEFNKKAMSHVITIFSPCRMSLGPMLPVELKKCPCRPVDFRGLRPCDWGVSRVSERVSWKSGYLLSTKRWHIHTHASKVFYL